ncbi:D-sedoheptulose-7-phosphate isomerase [Nitrosopumilus piranensis]|uniref:Phosphoheptose isomerase n=1 Tax=Nitrosopumilus piranensis TaxID=1582439 RepID=A0A0C5BSI3_9ARCH|nr:SIS domain-containing protein [Nitrosopumilus piranensis]AJM91271.1 Phosphoheptose isomerase [Nitrosopumilus piranensis]
MKKIEPILHSFLDEQKICVSNITKNSKDLEDLIRLLIKARNNGKKIFTMGNGGSGSTASHFVSDLLKTAIIKDKKRFQAFSLTDNIPVILAWSNDVSYDRIFIEQLKNTVSNGDVVIAFSGSGNSKNLISALKFCKKNHVKCIGFSGSLGGKMKQYCDLCIRVPSTDMLTIESQHVLLCHGIVSTIRKLGNPQFKYN